MKRRTFLIVLILGLIIAFSIREYRLHHAASSEEAFIGGRGATVWNSTAEIREPVANLSYGQEVRVHQHYAEETLVSTASGIRGWVSSASLMDPQLWRNAALLAESAKSMPVQAAGHTRARANIHTKPGMDAPVIVQAPPDSSLVVLEHASDVAQPQLLSAPNAQGANPQDWWLVRANVKDAGTVVGWSLSRLIALDLPEPLPEYQSSEGVHVVAWFEINRAADAASGQLRPEYLVAGNRTREAACDFTLVRVYTWSSARNRYETGFMDSRLCGQMPMKVTPAKSPGQDAYFTFQNFAPSGTETRTYRMKSTSVRRIDASASEVRHTSRRPASKRSRR